ncbi:phage tail protein [Photobacterium sp. OFAV2-7]|nr:phage tail protein [Photobacterium sp. OFAV2-7]MCG7588042.1 phage tail protein [Photobacterium sp. OFAV2-7]
MNLPEIKFKWWMGRGELAKFARALHNYWGHVEAALKMPLEQHDPLTAPLGIVDLLAWQRDVKRLGQEPEDIYRIRVAHSYSFARDGGSKAGWEEMFDKLGYPHIAQDERLKEVDWDVISLQIRDGDLTDVPELLDTVIRQYGRTCRRYQYTTYIEMPIAAKPQAIEASYETTHITTRINVPMQPKVSNMECEYYTAIVKG